MSAGDDPGAIQAPGDFDAALPAAFEDSRLPDAGADRAAAFGPVVIAIRWGTTVASLALSVQPVLDGNARVALWAGLLVVYTIARTFRPIHDVGQTRGFLEVMLEIAFLLVAVCTTGFWESPLIFSLMTAVAVAAFSRGFTFGLIVGAGVAIMVSAPYLASRIGDTKALQNTVQFSLAMLIAALIAGYAHRISGDADRQHTLALDRLGRLADANALLFSLHRVTQTLPASLDLEDVLDTTIGRLRGLFTFDFAAILILDETEGSWQVARSEGARLPRSLEIDALPPPLQAAQEQHGVVSVGDLTVAGGPGLAPKASAGMYAVLLARGALIGLLAVERQVIEEFAPRDLELLRGFVEPVALAIDNARWFGRLRTVGADEERTRIARDLHDRIGQSLAYLAFELDRIIVSDSDDKDIHEDLERLRDDVRGVVREVRDTLYDLRTDVSDSQDLPSTLDAFTSRVAERAELTFDLHLDRQERLPLLQEREMWRIAQEAITNVERHAQASHVRVVWRCNGESAALDITDNGTGFPVGRAGRLDSYGLMGMRERASAIGAMLDLTSEPGKGTRVRCTLLATPNEDSEGPEGFGGAK